MKKTLISAALIAALLCSQAGWTYAFSDNDMDLQPEQVQATEYLPGRVPAQTTAVDGMIAPINALVLSMLEHEMDYDEDNTEFLWNSLYYMISLYGQYDARAEVTDEELILPRETVEDYAASLFTNYNGLPELPEAMLDRVTYDSRIDSYSLRRGDAGLSETRIGSVEHLAGGGLKVGGALTALEDDSVLCYFSAQMEANDSMFGFSISGMDVIY